MRMLMDNLDHQVPSLVQKKECHASEKFIGERILTYSIMWEPSNNLTIRLSLLLPCSITF